jgi:putative SOS response-associated peptidase YedK
MCGRYAASKSADTLVEEFDVDDAPAEALAPDFNVAPTKKVYAVLTRRPEGGEPRRRLAVVRWGLVPAWAKDPSVGSRMINARMETVAEKPAYKRAFARRRCLLPADGYFEWYTPTEDDAPRGRGGKPVKQPFFIHPRDGSSMAMAGIYEIWHDKTLPDDDPAGWLWTVSVLTTQAEDALGRIHDRMPLLVEPDGWGAWLDPDADDADRARSLLVPAAPGLLDAYPVSTAVNSVKNNGPELLDPLPAEPAPADAPASGAPDGQLSLEP